jgi:cyclopropane-fatty-acyl-phospholipid synthase
MELPTAYYRLFLDTELNHSSGYFHCDGMSLDRAQRSKIDTILARSQMQPAMRLLDVGCGWGAAVRTAATTYGAQAIGITVNPVQHSYALERQASEPPAANIEFRLQPWEEFNERVDRITCINSFESFTNKEGFLSHCRTLLPKGGRLVMLTVTADRPMFRVRPKNAIINSARLAGFDVEVSESLSAHYVRTLECFVENLDRRQQEALKFVTRDQLKNTMRYYSKSAEFLRRGLNDMFEFTLIAQ